MRLRQAARLLTYLLAAPALVQAASPPVAPAGSPSAQAAPSAFLPEGQATLKADSVLVDTRGETYRAAGHVRLVQDGVSLMADSVIYHRLTDQAQADGSVVLEKGGDTLHGQRLSFNLTSQQGSLFNGDLFIKQSNFRVRGERVEKTGDQDYRIERGSFTTCDGDKPSWRFEAKKVELTLDEFATARDAVFYAGDVPLLYTPYLLFPVKRERSSGLLLPKFGHSSKKGIYYTQPFYLVLDPSKDLTVDLDLQTDRGVGVGGDFRYLRPHESEGRLQWYGIYDTEAEKFRGELNQRHLEQLSPNTTIASDIHLIADRSYYKDYGELAGDYNKQLLQSTASFEQRWQRYGFAAEIRYAEDLVAANNDATLQRLPALSFTAAGEKLGPLFWSMNSGFTDYQAKSGTTGQRLDLHPRLTLYDKPLEPLDFSVYAGYRELLYNGEGAAVRSGTQQVGQADAGATLSLPLERIYDGHLRHLLIPSVEYSLLQARPQNGLPFFDYGDDLFGQSLVRWSVNNVFTGKFLQEGGPAEYRDLAYLKLSQGYQFSGQRRDLPLVTLVDPGHRLTDLWLETRVMPLKWLSVGGDSRYNMVDNNLSTGSLAVEAKGEGKTLAHVGYRFARDELDYLEGRFVFPIAPRFTADFLGRYSFDRGGFLESRYAIEYRQQCWSVILAYAQRPAIPNAPGNISDTGNKEVTVNFTLYGLGELGPVRAF
jgi:LPS-assembly protein